MTTNIVCVHGVNCHLPGFQNCWGRVLPAGDVNLLGVHWNRLDDGRTEQADWDAPFPSGWIEVDGARGAKEVWMYVRRPRRHNAYRETAIQRCMDTIREAAASGDPLCVISHSLGSVIAYQALHRLGTTVQVKTLVTIGSPLNDRLLIRRVLAHDVGRSPSGRFKRPPVERWVNLMDTADFLYPMSRESVFAKFDTDTKDVDRTDKLHDATGKCSALPPLNLGFFLRRLLRGRLNAASLCAHLCYFHPASQAGEIIGEYLQ